ncbi:MAG: hypothetical protein IJZ57_04460 [Clostridia bacterium]|nr:hypothetical protein [Clostridia bacterium]
MRMVKENRIFIILFAVFTALFSLFPLTGDDLGWATSDGMTLLKNGFEGYNGRYLGNLCAIFFTRHDFLRPVVKSASIIFILYMLQKFTGKNEQFILLSSAVLLVPYSPFIQSIVWSSGFFNYTFSLCFILPCFYILFRKSDLRFIPVIVILGFCGQLFMETYTLLTLAVALGVLIIRIYKSKNIAIPFTYFISCVSGAIMMFSNSVYRQVLGGEDKYQSKADVITAFKNMFLLVPRYVLYACIPAALIIIVLLILNRKRNFIMIDKPKLSVYILLILGLSLPFCIVGPIGTRCFVGVNLILLLAIEMLTGNLDIKRLSKVLLIIVLCLNFIIYGVLALSNQNKIEAISQAVSRGEKQIELEHTKLYIFAHGMDDEAKNQKFLNRFCEYFGFPKDIKINFK